MPKITVHGGPSNAAADPEPDQGETAAAAAGAAPEAGPASAGPSEAAAQTGDIVKPPRPRRTKPTTTE